MRVFQLITTVIVMAIAVKPVCAEFDPDSWIGLWIGDGQIGDFPDFGTFSLGDDYILISSFNGHAFEVVGQTHFGVKRYGDVAGRGVVSDKTMTIDGAHCSVTLKKKQNNTYATSQDYLLVQSDKDCGSMYAKFSGKYTRFRNSLRQ